MSCTCNTDPCSCETAPAGKRISELPSGILSDNDLFVIVDVSEQTNTSVTFKDIVYFDSSGTTLSADNFGDAINEVNNKVDSLSGFDGYHNDLQGLQGGIAGEYYHLTSDEHDVVITISTGDGLVPPGGDDGQVLAKSSSADYDYEWVTDTGAGIPDVTTSGTFLRTSGSWVPSDEFDSNNYYTNIEVDGILTNYATSAELDGKEDYLGTGNDGQVLATSGSDIRYWVDLPAYNTPTLQEVTNEGNTTSDDIIVGTPSGPNTTITDGNGGAPGISMRDNSLDATLLFDGTIDNGTIYINHRFRGGNYITPISATDYVQRQYVDTELDGKEDKLTYGTSGQIMATNDDQDGYVWVDKPEDTFKVKTTSNDPKEGYLADEIIGDGCINIDVVDYESIGCPIGEKYLDAPNITSFDEVDFGTTTGDVTITPYNVKLVGVSSSTTLRIDDVYVKEQRITHLQHSGTQPMFAIYDGAKQYLYDLFIGIDVDGYGPDMIFTVRQGGTVYISTKIDGITINDTFENTVIVKVVDGVGLSIKVIVNGEEITYQHNNSNIYYINGYFAFNDFLSPNTTITEWYMVGDDSLPTDCTGEVYDKKLQISCDPTLIDLSIGDLSDVDTTTNAPVENDLLKWDGSSNWIPTNIGSIPSLNVVNFVLAGGVNNSVIMEIHSSFGNRSGFAIPSSLYETRIKAIKIKASYAHHDGANPVEATLRLASLPYNGNNMYDFGNGSDEYYNENIIPTTINGSRYHFVQDIDDDLDIVLPDDSVLFCELHPNYWSFTDVEVSIIYSLTRV